MQFSVRSILTGIAVVLTFSLNAQYKLDANLSSMYIDGTSSIHDWTETVEQFSGTLNVQTEGNTLKAIEHIQLSIPVKSIKSGKSSMDANTYEALKAKQHPHIKYVLKSATIAGDKVKLTGSLSIGGTTKTVSFMSDYKITADLIGLEGRHRFKMTDFNIDPPTALLGSIRTGDEVVIRYFLEFKK